jgi:YVTN family beta-propeller protein
MGFVNAIPLGIAFDPRHQRMYVTGREGVSVIDTITNTVIDRIRVRMGGIAFCLLQTRA